MALVSLVVPVYHNAASLPELLAKFRELADRNPDKWGSHTIGTNVPIIPASTAPTPPGASGNRFATMPTKNPWTTTPSGTWTP